MGLNIGHHFLFALNRVFGLEGWGIVGLGPQVKSPRKNMVNLYRSMRPQQSRFFFYSAHVLTPIVRAPTTRAFGTRGRLKSACPAYANSYLLIFH